MFPVVRDISMGKPAAVKTGFRGVCWRFDQSADGQSWNAWLSNRFRSRVQKTMHVTTSLPLFVEFGCQNTRHNLPRASSLKRTESNFLRKFERVYLAAERNAAVAGLEVGWEGFGRADRGWLAWRGR